MVRLGRRLLTTLVAALLAILSRSFSVKGPNTNNYISLGYARDIDISPIPLQRAAYNGCDKGLRLALR